MRETWKPVVGFENYYEVSDHGRVRSKTRMVKDFGKGGTPRTREFQSRPIIPGPANTYGHLHVNLYRNARGHKRLVHRLVAAAFGLSGQVIRHKNNDPSDNRLSNLLGGTQKDNVADAIAAGWRYGGKNGGASRVGPQSSG